MSYLRKWDVKSPMRTMYQTNLPSDELLQSRVGTRWSHDFGMFFLLACHPRQEIHTENV